MTWLLATAVLLVQASTPSNQSEPTPAQLEHELTAYRRLLLDWASLTRYGSDNSELKPPKPGENRVVFLGSELTERWGEGKAQFFPGKPYLNRGILRQTSPQLLVRFRQDVIALKPAVVVIETGTNDIASVTGPSPEGTIAENIESMVELAKVHGIKVVLASVPPICDCTSIKQSIRRPPGKIIGLNGWIKNYAEKNGHVYLDYYAALVQGRNLRKDLTDDGFLLNDAAYELMAPLAEKAIAQALAKP